MTESRELAVRQPEPPTRDVARVDVDSWIGVIQPVGHLAERIAGTEFVPKSMRNSAPAVAAAILYGREVGLAPMTSLTQTHVIEGRPSISAEAMRAMIFAAGHELIFDEVSGAVCRMRARRAGAEHWTTLEWTIDMARAAGLTGKNNWKSYPRAMLIARCTGDLARMVFPDVIHGFRSVEEMEDLGKSEDAPPSGERAAAGSTTVSRGRRTTKKAAAALPAAKQQTAPAAAMPPLPGEEGYDDQSTPAPAPETPEGGASDDRGEPSGARSGGTEPAAGEGTEDAPPDGDDAPEPEAAPPAAPEPGSGAPDEESGEGATSTPAPEPDSSRERPPAGPHTRPQMRMLMGIFGNLLDGEDREERHLVASSILGHEVESFSRLTKDEAKTLIDTLSTVKDREHLNRILDTIDETNALPAAAEAGEDQS